MDIEDYINRSDVLVYFEDLMYMDYYFWFFNARRVGLFGEWKL